jgi:hypothetical protein
MNMLKAYVEVKERRINVNMVDFSIQMKINPKREINTTKLASNKLSLFVR